MRTGSIRRWVLGASGLVVVISLMLVSVAARGCPRLGTPTRPGAMLIPDPGTPPDGDIDAVDFTVDEDRLLHLVWHVRAGDRNSSYVRAEEVWYRRCDLRTNRWSQARLLVSGSGVDRSPHILRVGDSLHVIVPYNLRHFVSGDSGDTWIEEAALMHPESYIAQHFAAEADGDSLVLAYVSRKRTAPGSYDLGPSALFVSVWGTDRMGSAQILAETRAKEFRTLLDAQPGLAITSTSRNVYLSTNHMYDDIVPYHNPQTNQDMQVHQMHSRGVLYLWQCSKDTGSWSPPDSAEWPAEVYQPPNSSSVYEFAASEFGGMHFVFAGNWALHCVTWRDGAPRVSRSVASVPQRWFSASLSTSSITPAITGAGGQVVWIDTRYGRTDRTPLNPLGGIPWSDDPDWRNNDVFAVPIESISSQGGEVVNLVPARLTHDVSFTQCVMAHATSRAVYVVWSGWRHYRRDGSHLKTPPSVWYTRLPLH